VTDQSKSNVLLRCRVLAPAPLQGQDGAQPEEAEMAEHDADEEQGESLETIEDVLKEAEKALAADIRLAAKHQGVAVENVDMDGVLVAIHGPVLAALIAEMRKRQRAENDIRRQTLGLVVTMTADLAEQAKSGQPPFDKYDEHTRGILTVVPEVIIKLLTRVAERLARGESILNIKLSDDKT